MHNFLFIDREAKDLRLSMLPELQEGDEVSSFLLWRPDYEVHYSRGVRSTRCIILVVTASQGSLFLWRPDYEVHYSRGVQITRFIIPVAS